MKDIVNGDLKQKFPVIYFIHPFGINLISCTVKVKEGRYISNHSPLIPITSSSVLCVRAPLPSPKHTRDAMIVARVVHSVLNRAVAVVDLMVRPFTHSLMY